MVSKLGFRWPRGAFFYPSADTPTSSRRAGANPLCIVTFSRLSLTSGPILDGVHRQRPGPLWWTWYAFGGKLPDRHGEWVLNDVTCRTWWLRHVARSLVQLAPVAALLLVVLGPGGITYLGLAAGTILALIYSVAYIEETGEHRLGKYGYPVGTGREMRARRGRRVADQEHYNATYRSGA